MARKVLIAVLITALGWQLSWAQAPTVSEDAAVAVVVTGSGLDEKAALDDAFSQAIGQVVGTMVDAETVVKNDQIIQDRILTATGAIVSKYERVKAPYQDHGLWKVRIKATVERAALRRDLYAANVITKDVNGQDLFAQAKTDLERMKDAPQIVRRAFENFPANVLSGEPVGQPRIVARRNGETVIAVTVRFAVDPQRYSQWYSAVAPFLQRIALDSAPLRFNPSDEKNLSPLGDRFKNVPQELKQNSFSFGTWPTLISDEAKRQTPEGSLLIALVERQGSSKGLLLTFEREVRPQIGRAAYVVPVAQIALLDERGTSIDELTRPLIFDGNEPPQPTDGDRYVLSPIFDTKEMGPLLTLYTHKGLETILKWTPSEDEIQNVPHLVFAPYLPAQPGFRNASCCGAMVRGISVEFPFTMVPDELARLKQVQVRLSAGSNSVAK